MKNTLSGRDERTFMKMLVHVPTDKVGRGLFLGVVTQGRKLRRNAPTQVSPP